MKFIRALSLAMLVAVCSAFVPNKADACGACITVQFGWRCVSFEGYTNWCYSISVNGGPFECWEGGGCEEIESKTAFWIKPLEADASPSRKATYEKLVELGSVAAIRDYCEGNPNCAMSGGYGVYANVPADVLAASLAPSVWGNLAMIAR